MKGASTGLSAEDQLAAPGDIPPFVGLSDQFSSPAQKMSAKTADWPEEEPIRIIDDSVSGVDFGSNVREPKVAPISTKSTVTKSAGSKLAQFMSGLSGTKFGAAETTQLRSEPTPQVSKVFNAAVPGSTIQSQTLNSLSVEDRKQLFKEEEQLQSSEDDIRQRFGANLKSALSSGTIIEGKFKFDSPVRIDGTLIGEVQASSLLIVGGDASVEAKVRVGSLVVLGVVKGNVEAEELIEVKSGGVLEGDVKCARFAIEEGGWFQGKVSPTCEPKPKALSKKVEKLAEPSGNPGSTSGSNFETTRSDRAQSEQLSLSGADIAEQSGVKASWSN
jgi:cytoskeletal protein CcmA (bactofilin family)